MWGWVTSDPSPHTYLALLTYLHLWAVSAPQAIGASLSLEGVALGVGAEVVEEPISGGVGAASNDGAPGISAEVLCDGL